MQGFSGISFSQVEYVSVDEALSRFVFLDQFPRPVYTRGKVALSDAEFTDYEIALTVPESTQLFYIRILDPIRVYVYRGIAYVVNGNSRLFTVDKLRASQQDYEFAPIPVQYILSDEELTDEQLIRLQYAANDSTRKHRAVDKMRQLHQFIERSVNAGAKRSQARKHAVKYFGVTTQTLSNAEKLITCDNATLQGLLDEERITTDAASILIDRSVEFVMTIDHLLEAIAHPTAVEDFYYKASNIKKWSDSFRKIAGTPEERLQQYVEENIRKDPGQDQLNTFVMEEVTEDNDLMKDYAAPVAEIDLEAAETAIDAKLSSPVFSPANTDRLSRILSAFPQKLSEGDCSEMFNEVLAMVHKYANRLPDADKAQLAKALEQF